MGDTASTGGKVLPFPNRAAYRRATAKWRDKARRAVAADDALRRHRQRVAAGLHLVGDEATTGRRETASERRKRKRREQRNAVLGSLLAVAALTVGAWWPVSPAHAAPRSVALTGTFEVERGYNLCVRRPQTFILWITPEGRTRPVRKSFTLRPVPRTDDMWTLNGGDPFPVDPDDCYAVDDNGNVYYP